jgi:hypothetical protein
MFITALCPTFRHPDLLENTLWLWDQQDYPADQRYLIIHDDAGTFDNQQGPNWRLFSTERFPSLPAKYNFMRCVAPLKNEAYLVWEDDDIYCPTYISKHVEQLKNHELSKPGVILTDYPGPGQLQAETAGPRFHSSLAFRRELIQRVGGWPVTDQADFDLQLIRSLFEHATSHGDPCPTPEECTYVMGWHTGYAHGQYCNRGPTDTGWYERANTTYTPVPHRGKLTAKQDARTATILKAMESKQWNDVRPGHTPR